MEFKIPKIIELPKISDNRGNLTFIQSGICPFEINRVYYLYDVPGGADRGAHAHRTLYQLLIAISGSFKAVLDDGEKIETYNLNRANFGLLITPGIWRELRDFSSGSVCLVLASKAYDESDYIRDYGEFREFRKSCK